MQANIIGVISIILTFGIAVFVHELGHFMFARLRGVGVEAFAIGMGPKIWSYMYKGTEYSLRWFPVGGFVRLHQMMPEDAVEETAPTGDESGEDEADRESIGEVIQADMSALYDKGLITKLLVFGGGVFFNFLAAIFAIGMLYSIGFDEPLPPEVWIGDIATDSRFVNSGLERGDIFMQIGGEPISKSSDIVPAFDQAWGKGKTNDGIEAKVSRGGQTIDLELPPMSEIDFELPIMTEDELEDYLTEHEEYSAVRAKYLVDLWELFDSIPYIGAVIPFSPAAKAGIEDGDLIVEINDKPIDSWNRTVVIIRKHIDEAVSIVVRRRVKLQGETNNSSNGDYENHTITLVPEENPDRPGTAMIGIIMGSGKVEYIKESVGLAFWKAPERTWNRLRFLAKANYDALTNSSWKSLKKNAGGPIMIGAMTFQRAKKGWDHAVDWFVTLNLILAIMNLLPIPVLDGGFIVLSVIEAVIRRPVPPKILQPIYFFFAMALIVLVIAISCNDILRTIF